MQTIIHARLAQLGQSREDFALKLSDDISVTRSTAADLEWPPVTREKPSSKSGALESVSYCRSSMKDMCSPSPLVLGCWGKKKQKLKLAATEFETSTVTEAGVDLEPVSIWPSFTAVKTHRPSYKRCLKPSA